MSCEVLVVVMDLSSVTMIGTRAVRTALRLDRCADHFIYLYISRLLATTVDVFRYGRQEAVCADDVAEYKHYFLRG